MKPGNTKVTICLSNPPVNESVNNSRNGHVWLSQNSFLNFLETRLGINTPELSFTSRLVDYLNCLEQVKSEDLFFFRSYQADPFAVARKLLLWRDELYMAGWTGIYKNSSVLTKRLRDMQTIEAVAQNEVSKGTGQRWQDVLSRLETDNVFISDIYLMEPLNFFAPLVQKTLTATGANLVVGHHPTETPENPASDLQKIQRLILIGDMTSRTENDGSLMLIESENSSNTASTTAQIIAQSSKNMPARSPLVISETNGYILDEHLEAIGLPRGGFSENSPWRPVFQVLPLALELLWDPISPRKMLQFLTNPVSPLPAFIRYRLGNLVAEKPGIGSQQWDETIDKVLAKEEDEQNRKAIHQDIKFWLECERFDAETGVSIDVILKRINAVSTWLGTQMAMSDDPNKQSLFATAKGQVEDLSSAVLRLEKYNDGRLNRADLRRLVDDIKGVGAPLADRYAELSVEIGALKSVRDSGGVYKAESEIIWSGLTGGNYLDSSFVTDAERQSLRAQEILFVEEANHLEALNQNRIRPVLMSRDRLVLISPKDRASDHPIWTRIITAFPDIKIHTEASALDLIGVKKIQVDPLSLPEKKREWHLGKTTKIPNTDYTSYSSLDKFLFKPHQWILNYPAKIKSGSLNITNEGNLLKGNLAHRLIETYLNAHTDIQDVDLDGIERWAETALTKLIAEEGAILLEEGAFRERVEFITIMKRALKVLITQLAKVGVISTETEKWEKAEFIGGSLQGSIDILAINAEGEEAIIDVKYGRAKYRREDLKNSQYLQLATYDRLRRTDPHLSFFTITDASMLNLSHNFFPDGECVDPDLGLTLDDYWGNIELIWSHRRKLFDDGIVDVPVEGTQPNASSAPEGIVLDIPETNDSFNDYTALTGWEVGA